MPALDEIVVRRISDATSIDQVQEILSDVLEEIRETLANELGIRTLDAWLEGIEAAFNLLPESVRDSILDLVPIDAIEAISQGGRFDFGPDFDLGPPSDPLPDSSRVNWFPPPTDADNGLVPGDSPDGIIFPKLEAGAEALLRKNVVTREQFDQFSDRAKENAFTIAGDLSEREIEHYRDMLYTEVHEGTSLAGFRDKLDETIGTSPLSDAQLENVYRTNTQAAFRDGREAVLQDPIVDSLFPYQQYYAVNDDRSRPEHKQLEKLGLDGTGIYRRDDPFWEQFTPPWDYNCRCSVNLLTLEAAARKGVTEAQEWLETGQPPVRPNWRLAAIPFPSNAGFGARSSVHA